MRSDASKLFAFLVFALLCTAVLPSVAQAKPVIKFSIEHVYMRHAGEDERGPAAKLSAAGPVDRLPLSAISGSLCLAAHAGGRHARVGQLNLAEDLLVFVHVGAEGEEQPLDVLGAHHDARLHGGLVGARQHAHEVEQELGARVGDGYKVGVNALDNVGRHGDFEIVGIFGWYRHNVSDV